MKTTLLSLSFLACTGLALLADQGAIVVKVSDAQGLPVKDAQVVAILKSGAYQDAKLDTADGQFKCLPTEECVKLYAAAPGFEGCVKKYPGAAGSIAMPLKQNPGKSSVVTHGHTALAGMEGTISPRAEGKDRVIIFTDKISLAAHGKAAPADFAVNHPIDAISPTGAKFKIWVMETTPQTCLVEYSLPAK